MIDKIACSFWMLCAAVFLSGAAWDIMKQYEQEKTEQTFVHKVEIHQMYSEEGIIEITP